MADTKKPDANAAAPKAAAAKKPVAAKVAPKAAAPKKGPATAQPKTGKTVTVKQIGSPARSEQWVYQTLAGLGLGKMNRTRTLEDTPSVRGMINRVHHLVKVLDDAA